MATAVLDLTVTDVGETSADAGTITATFDPDEIYACMGCGEPCACCCTS